MTKLIKRVTKSEERRLTREEKRRRRRASLKYRTAHATRSPTFVKVLPIFSLFPSLVNWKQLREPNFRPIIMNIKKPKIVKSRLFAHYIKSVTELAQQYFYDNNPGRGWEWRLSTLPLPRSGSYCQRFRRTKSSPRLRYSGWQSATSITWTVCYKNRYTNHESVSSLDC